MKAGARWPQSCCLSRGINHFVRARLTRINVCCTAPKSLTKRESVPDGAAEGATAPESLRQKDRFGFCDTLESVPAQAGATEGVSARTGGA
jgi:hypothetical protein